MDFARGLLEKYGWKEGKGLGKEETGIDKPLKPKLKFNTSGIGHDESEQFTFNWWEHAFNKAANRIKVTTSETSESMIEINDGEELLLTTKKPWIAKLEKRKELKYGSFLKTETLIGDGSVVPAEEMRKISDDEHKPTIASIKHLSDDEIFQICGGRTGHKAARHGLKLTGKLARVQEQEKDALKEHSSVETFECENKRKSAGKKRKKRKISEVTTGREIGYDNTEDSRVSDNNCLKSEFERECVKNRKIDCEISEARISSERTENELNISVDYKVRSVKGRRSKK